MFYHKATQQYIMEGNPFVINGLQYPQNWLNLSTPAEKTAAGLTEVTIQGQPADDRFYFVSSEYSDGVLVYTNVPKDLDMLKTFCINTVNNTAYRMLATSDWRAIKAAELNVPMPTEWSTFRESVRTVANSARTSIEACTTVEELQQASNIVWPEEPKGA